MRLVNVSKDNNASIQSIYVVPIDDVIESSGDRDIRRSQQ